MCENQCNKLAYTLIDQYKQEAQDTLLCLFPMIEEDLEERHNQMVVAATSK